MYRTFSVGIPVLYVASVRALKPVQHTLTLCASVYVYMYDRLILTTDSIWKWTALPNLTLILHCTAVLYNSSCFHVVVNIILYTADIMLLSYMHIRNIKMPSIVIISPVCVYVQTLPLFS